MMNNAVPASGNQSDLLGTPNVLVFLDLVYEHINERADIVIGDKPICPLFLD